MPKPELKEIEPEKLKFGQIISLNASGIVDGKEQPTTYKAMLYNHKFGPNDEYLGLEVFIIAAPGTFAGQFSQNSRVVNERADIEAMGIEGSARIHYKAVTIPKQLFPFVFGGNNATCTGALPGPLRNEIINITNQLEQRGNIPHMGIAHFAKTEINPNILSVQLQPVAEHAALSERFERATHDITLKNAVIVGILEEYLSDILSERALPKESQIEKGLISEDEEPVENIQTLGQLEKLLNRDEQLLKAFWGLSNEDRHQQALDAARFAIESFKAAIKADAIKASPYRGRVIELTP